MKSIGCKLDCDKTLTQKSYWKLIKNLMNKSKAPKVPPLKVDDKFVMNCAEKAKLFKGVGGGV